jgi:hypothetical protein
MRFVQNQIEDEDDDEYEYDWGVAGRHRGTLPSLHCGSGRTRRTYHIRATRRSRYDMFSAFHLDLITQ